MTIFIMASMPLYAYDFESGGIYYKIKDGNNVEVTSGNSKYEGNIVIPEKVTYNGKNYSVTTIGDLAFRGCSGLTSIIIPNSVTSIGSDAFYGCSGLTSINIPNSVTSIGNYTFGFCSGLTSISIPNSVTSIGDGAFYDCRGLISITIPNSVTNIGSSAFFSCRGLTSITIPNSVTSIGDYAFSGCSGLTSIKVESGNTVYDSRNNCNAIIKKSNNELIAGCRNTVIPNSVTSIGSSAFYYCSGLTSISIPNSVTSIGDGAFYGCSGLTSIKVESGNTVYDSRNNCNAIIKKSNNELIAGCRNTVIPNFVTSIGDWAFFDCSGLISISIPNSVTSIGSLAFYGCSGLTSITIPNSVTSIGNCAFEGCSGLKDVISEIKTPFEISEYVFSVYSTAKLTVPSGTKSAYQSTNYWNKFTNIVEKETETIIQGDVNGDQEVNVSDIVEVVNYINNNASAIFLKNNADLNGDGEVNVTDIVWMVNIIMSGQSGAARKMSNRDGDLTDGTP